MAEKNTHYKNSILKELYFNDKCSAADLSTRVELSVPVTTKMVNELIGDGLVEALGYAPSTGGRPPLLYAIAADQMYLLAVAMDQFMTRMVLLNMKNQHVSALENFSLPLTDNPLALDTISDRIYHYIGQSGVDPKKIIGIGIGMPGFIDSEKGVNYSFLGSNDESVAERITRKTGYPVFIDNDSSLIGRAELKFGGARNAKTAMVVNLGWGIGLGMILNGGLFKGYNGFAGEFSHIPLFLNKKMCSCGKYGCLETECSLVVLVEKAAAALDRGQVTLMKDFPKDDVQRAAEIILDAANKGDTLAVELLTEAGYHIGRGVAILIHLFNPEVIILSGLGAAAGKVWQAPVQQALNEHCIPRLSANTRVEISSVGYGAELIGAAALVMEEAPLTDRLNATAKTPVLER